MKKCFALIVAYILFLASFAWAAEELRPLGMSSATGGYSGDIRVGNTCTTSPLGKYYCGLNARHIYFFSDNTVDVDNLYPLASADTGFPYVSGGTWTVDSAATYRGRLGTGTADNTTFWRGDGAWSTPTGTITGATTSRGLVATSTTLGLIETCASGELLKWSGSLWACGTDNNTGGTSLPWDNITRTLSAGVTDLELSHVDNVTSPIQTQLNAKQDYDAGLAVLSFPTAYRMWISNGVGVITEVAFGADNTCWQSNGASATPTWETCGSGSGNYDADNVAITGGTINNTTIGISTPVAGSFTSIIGSSLEIGAIDNTTFGYLDNVSSGIQTQLDLRAPINSPAFTGNASFDNEVTAVQYNSTGADNTHFINTSNSGKPNVGTEAVGDCHYDNTGLVWECWNGSAWATSFTTVAYGSNPTVDSAGKLGIDNTADQLIYFGTAEKVISPVYTKDFVVKNATASDNTLLFKADTNITLTQLDCVIDPGDADATDNVTVTLLECTSAGDTCVSSGASVVATNAGASDSTITDAAIDANDWVKVEFSSVQGTASFLSCSVRYVITRQ